MADDVEQALRRGGLDGEGLLLLARRAAIDALKRHGAFLDDGRFEELVSYFTEIGCRYAGRFQTGHHIGMSTYFYRVMRRRYRRSQHIDHDVAALGDND